MKGIELLASIIAILMMIGIATLFGGAIIFILNASKQPTTSPIKYELYLSSIYPPIKFETMLLTYLESTEENSGLQFKKILTYAAYQKNITNIYVEDKNKINEVTNLRQSTYNIFSFWLEGSGYMLVLNVGGDGYVIAENKRALTLFPDEKLKIKRISVPIFVDRKFYNPDKTRELPLNVTLDFYVQ